MDVDVTATTDWAMLSAERELREHLRQSCRGADRLDQSLFASAWHPGGTIDDPIAGWHGPVADLAGPILAGLGSNQTHVHTLADPRIAIFGDAATSETRFLQIRRLDTDSDGRSRDAHLRGLYRDRWSRRAGRWGIDHREVVGLLSWEQAVSPAAIGGHTRRDPSDPGSRHLAQITPMREAGPDTLLAERAILHQLNTYCRGLDRFDLELWKSVWHPEATLDYESGDIFGSVLDRALQMTCGHAAFFCVHSHQIANPTIRIAGDRAVSETCANAVLRGYPDRAGGQIDSHYLGRYLDSWSFRDGRWAIDHRRLVEELMWQQPAMHPHIGGATRRDGQDPSHALFASLAPPSQPGLEALLAEREIRRQVGRYCDAADRLDPQAWQGLWHEGARLELDSEGVCGPAADLLGRLAPDAVVRSHTPTNSIVVVNADRAVSETGLVVTLRRARGGRMVRETRRARLLDAWSCRDGRWAIDHRREVEDFAWAEDEHADLAGVGPGRE